MTVPAFTSNAAKRGRAVAFVVMGVSLGLAWAHRQQRLRAIQRLDLAFLVDTQHQSTLGRIEVEADNVSYLLDELGICRKLEGLAAMRLQRKCVPDAMHSRDRHA